MNPDDSFAVVYLVGEGSPGELHVLAVQGKPVEGTGEWVVRIHRTHNDQGSVVVACGSRCSHLQTVPANKVYATREIAEKRIAAICLETAASLFAERYAKGLCPHCGGPIEPSKQVGRCLYAACGHQVGQVDSRGKGR